MDTPLLETPVPGSSRRWQLSAPESYVLLQGPRADGVETFKKGLLELVARGMLRIEKRPTAFLVAGPHAAQVCATAAPREDLECL